MNKLLLLFSIMIISVISCGCIRLGIDVLETVAYLTADPDDYFAETDIGISADHLRTAADTSGLYGMECNQTVFNAYMDEVEKMYSEMVVHCKRNYPRSLNRCKAKGYKRADNARYSAYHTVNDYCRHYMHEAKQIYIPVDDDEFRTAQFQAWYNDIPQETRNNHKILPVTTRDDLIMQIGVDNQKPDDMRTVFIDNSQLETAVANAYHYYQPDIAIMRVALRDHWSTVRDDHGNTLYKVIYADVYVLSPLDYKPITDRYTQAYLGYKPETGKTILKTTRPFEVRQLYEHGSFGAPKIVALSDDDAIGMNQFYDPDYYTIIKTESFMAKTGDPIQLDMSDRSIPMNQINTPDANGLTPLFYYVKQGLFDDVKLLVDYGADVNATDKDGKTPIFHALDVYAETNQNGGRRVYGYGSEMIRIMAAAGADINHRDKAGYSAVDYALVNDSPTIWKELIGLHAHTTLSPLINHFRYVLVQKQFPNEIVRTQELKKIQNTIKQVVSSYGVSPNGIDNNKCKMTYLMQVTDMFDAAAKVNSDVTRYLDTIVHTLIREGVEINAKTPSGATALDYLPNSAYVSRQSMLEAGAKSGNAPSCRLL